MLDTTTSPTNPNRTYTVRGAMVVSRTFLDGAPGVPGLFEITVIRSHRQKGATYQGIVFQHDNAWTAEVTRGKTRETVGTYTDYADAENALVKIRTGQPSYQKWDGPRPVAPAKPPECIICGWELRRDGDCTRPDLHWDAPSDYTPEQTEKFRMRRTFHEGKNRSAARTYWAEHDERTAARRSPAPA